jgi:putative flippase GtrA
LSPLQVAVRRRARRRLVATFTKLIVAMVVGCGVTALILWVVFRPPMPWWPPVALAMASSLLTSYLWVRVTMWIVSTRTEQDR